ncbi:YfhE family protein [Bacillus sp. UFRGS-B20]|nr:YfhE family protein [Bacillus sp. UFRGS-B20]
MDKKKRDKAKNTLQYTRKFSITRICQKADRAGQEYRSKAFKSEK